MSTDPGPLRYSEVMGSGWVPLSDDDATQWAALVLNDAGVLLHDRYCYVKNREGKLDRWRGAGHVAYGEPFAHGR